MAEFIKFIIYASIYVGLVSTSFFILSFLFGEKKKKLLYRDDELPIVSVIIPAYNEEKSIESTIRSILQTDYPKSKFQVIVVDDGSSDNTFKIARKFKKHGVEVYTKTNEGKGVALNYGLKKARGDVIFSMDADTYVDRNSLKEMVRYFKNKKVMCVSPSILVDNPKNTLQRVQYIEYIMGLFLRKAFANVNSIHITPGAFSAYRKSFFDKYGGYDEGNITEDLELAMRIQYHGYIIEHSPESLVYTIAPDKFYSLLKQRRRWYIGLLKNTIKYNKLISPKYGDLGMFVIPIAWISIFFAVFVTLFSIFKFIFKIKDEILFLNSINFDLGGFFNVNLFFIERLLFSFFSNPVIFFIILFILIMVGYLLYATKNIKNIESPLVNLPLFFLFFSVLFGFWWIVSFIYFIFHRDISWR
ncbi:MAG: glycosyltransferase family 2 protein [Candidatus Pacearchaeota archaeon]